MTTVAARSGNIVVVQVHRRRNEIFTINLIFWSNELTRRQINLAALRRNESSWTVTIEYARQ